jgi:uncharacterized membrane protein ArfC
MSQVQWPLVALAFVIGLALTPALMVRRIKIEAPTAPVPVKSAAKAAPPKAKKATAGDPATKKIRFAQESSTTKFPRAHESPTTRIPVGEEFRTTELPVDHDPETTEIPVAETTQIPLVTYASYGPGSARAQPDGSGPDGWLVKGRSDTRLYYTPNDPIYDPTVAQVWFEDEASALRAFFTPWRKSAKKR